MDSTRPTPEDAPAQSGGPPENAGGGRCRVCTVAESSGESYRRETEWGMLDFSEARMLLTAGSRWVCSLRSSTSLHQGLPQFPGGKFIRNIPARKEDIRGPFWLWPSLTCWWGERPLLSSWLSEDAANTSCHLRALTIPKHRWPPDHASQTEDQSGEMTCSRSPWGKCSSLRQDSQGRSPCKDDIWWRPESGAEASHERGTLLIEGPARTMPGWVEFAAGLKNSRE